MVQGNELSLMLDFTPEIFYLLEPIGMDSPTNPPKSHCKLSSLLILLPFLINHKISVTQCYNITRRPSWATCKKCLLIGSAVSTMTLELVYMKQAKHSYENEAQLWKMNFQLTGDTQVLVIIHPIGLSILAKNTCQVFIKKTHKAKCHLILALQKPSHIKKDIHQWY